MHALHALLGKEKLARPKYWYCHCCLKQNTTVHDDPALNKCVTCGRPGTYTQDGCALPLHGKGGAVYRPEQVVNVLDNLDESDMYNWTALHSAAAKGNAAVVRELLELGATADALTKHKQTPLHLAVYAGSLPSVKLLVEAGARVNCVTQVPSFVDSWALPRSCSHFYCRPCARAAAAGKEHPAAHGGGGQLAGHLVLPDPQRRRRERGKRAATDAVAHGCHPRTPRNWYDAAERRFEPRQGARFSRLLRVHVRVM